MYDDNPARTISLLLVGAMLGAMAHALYADVTRRLWQLERARFEVAAPAAPADDE